MSVKSIMTKRLCLALGGALAVTAVLVTHRGGSIPGPAGDRVIFVYFPSLCAAPGDSSNCQEIPRPERPAFKTMAACSAYAEVQLRHEHNPRIMASCMKQWEG
jgi:hypothetical protein